jgi:hypothetical protein
MEIENYDKILIELLDFIKKEENPNEKEKIIYLINKKELKNKNNKIISNFFLNFLEIFYILYSIKYKILSNIYLFIKNKKNIYLKISNKKMIFNNFKYIFYFQKYSINKLLKKKLFFNNLFIKDKINFNILKDFLLLENYSSFYYTYNKFYDKIIILLAYLYRKNKYVNNIFIQE